MLNRDHGRVGSDFVQHIDKHTFKQPLALCIISETQTPGNITITNLKH